MSTPSTTMSDFDRQPPAPAVISATQPFLWSIRRELWEYRSIYVAPAIVVVLTLFGFLIGSVHHIRKVREAMSLDPMQLHKVLESPYNSSAMFLMGIAFLVSLFYCIEAMQGERRDRSILFWKSLPLSDLTVVLSKMSIPLILLPVIAVVLTVVTHVVMLVLNVMIFQASGIGVAILWGHLSLTPMWTMMAYHMLILHGLWFAPFYAWLLLVSAWARRAALLWAVLPLAAIGVVEKIAFNTTHFANWMMYRFGGAPGAGAYPGNEMATHDWMHLSLGQVLFNPSLWCGLIIAAIFLFVAARIRRNRGPI